MFRLSALQAIENSIRAGLKREFNLSLDFGYVIGQHLLAFGWVGVQHGVELNTRAKGASERIQNLCQNRSRTARRVAKTIDLHDRGIGMIFAGWIDNHRRLVGRFALYGSEDSFAGGQGLAPVLVNGEW